MHDFPTNNETDIIRNIFKNSLLIEAAGGKSKSRGKGRERSRERMSEAEKAEAERAAAEAAETPTPEAVTDASKLTPKGLERLSKAGFEVGPDGKIRPKTATPISPDAIPGAPGPQARAINPGERFTDPVTGQPRDVVRDPVTGQVVRTQEAPPPAKVKEKRELSDAELQQRRDAARKPRTPPAPPPERVPKNPLLPIIAAGTIIGGHLLTPFLLSQENKKTGDTTKPAPSNGGTPPVSPTPPPTPGPVPTPVPGPVPPTPAPRPAPTPAPPPTPPTPPTPRPPSPNRVPAVPPVIPTPAPRPEPRPAPTPAPEPTRTLPTITRVLPPSETGGVDRGYQNVPVRTTETPEGRKITDEDLGRIVPGSQSWSQLTPGEQQRLRNMYSSGKVGSSLNIRFKEGKFDEPGYGDQGSKGDIVKALNAVQLPKPAPAPTPEQTVRDITSGGSSASTDTQANRENQARENRARTDAAFAASMARIDARTNAADAQLRARIEQDAAVQRVADQDAAAVAQRAAFANQDIADMQARAAAVATGTPGSRERQAAMDRVRWQQSPSYRPPQRPEPSVPPRSAWRGGQGMGVGPGLMEHYYNILSERLETLEEASQQQRAEARAKSMGFNLPMGHPRGRGPVNVAGIRPERLGLHLQSLVSARGGERTFSGEGQESTPKDTGKQPSWGERLKPHIITLMGAADDYKIELSKEEAVNSRSRDRRELLSRYPAGSDVHKAAQAVDEIMKSVRRD
jgi:hypothetical protein